MSEIFISKSSLGREKEKRNRSVKVGRHKGAVFPKQIRSLAGLEYRKQGEERWMQIE